MRYLILYFIVACTFSIKGFSSSESVDDCGCPEAKCLSPCEEQMGLTFYTEKCASGKKVKSCAKPTCVEMQDPNDACLAFRSNKKENRSVASSGTEASANGSIPVGEVIGKVALVKGQAWIKSEFGSQNEVINNMNVRVDEMVITSSHSNVKVKLINGNILDVLPNTMLKMTDINIESKKTLIDLLKGKVRSKVNTKLNGNNEFFKIRTPSAVAGVRGTDFVISYEVSQKAVTKVQTLEGKVDLASGDNQQIQTLTAGQEASFVVAANSTEVFNEDEIDNFIARGYMTPVYTLTENEIKTINNETHYKTESSQTRKIASNKNVGKNICKEPLAQLNQCSWSCQNNPKGESRCRTDLPQVQCIRKICNANGEWADEMRLPATFFEKCLPESVKVGPCDY